MCRTLVAFAAATLLLPDLPGQEGLRVTQVPTEVRLPAPGSNLLLEVEVNDQPATVWLAVDQAAQDRVPLTAVGNGRYQLNLGAPAVADLLPTARDHGELFVFARIGDRSIQSPAIAWSRAIAGPERLRCIVRTRGAVARRLQPHAEAWIDPATLERIEIEGAAERQATVVARLGELDLPLVRQAATGTWALEPTASLRERLADSGAFEIELRRGTATESFRFRCIPAQLELDETQATFVVPQRKRAPVPGSRGWLEVRIDDITGGHVRFELVDAEGRVVVPARLMHERDHAGFALGGRDYVVTLPKLVNVLVGEDHAEFAVQPVGDFRPDRIGQLLTAVRESGDTFVREGKDYTGKQAAQFLVAKLAAQRAEPPTVDDFVDRLASQSSRSGEPYRVRRVGGDEVTMREWLRGELQRLEAATGTPRGR